MGYSIEMWPAPSPPSDMMSRPAQRQPGEVIAQLARNPRPSGVAKLTGEDGLYRARAGDYRAIYRIEDYRLLLLVIKVGHHRDIYR